MEELLTAAQMRTWEGEAITSGAVTGLALMERAGKGVLDAAFATWPELAATSGRAVIYCGPGNNGGDGYVIARLLVEWGWQVSVFALGDPAGLPPDAKANAERWTGLGPIHDLVAEDGTACAAAWDTAPDLFVDALFGTGLARGLDGALADRVRQVAEACARHRGTTHCLAVDIPSGLCADSGRVLGDPGVVIPADLSVTFHRRKLGHMLADGPATCGMLRIADIGLTARHWTGAATDLALEVAPPSTLGKGQGHKYDHGHALVLSGPLGRSGAARLAARGALRVGAGLVTVAAPTSAMPECAAQLTAIMLRPCDGTEGLATLLQDPRLNAICLGPGLGLGAETRQQVAAALERSETRRGVVLDADALTAIEGQAEALFEQTRAAGAVVLTPHFGEFRRLFPDLADPLTNAAQHGPATSRVDAVRAAADRAGCTVLLKGPDTVIAEATGRVAVHSAAYGRAAPWLATAGSGDVFAGLITGLIAQGHGPFEAAQAAAWLHVSAARQFGPGLIAEDLPDQLPSVFRELGL